MANDIEKFDPSQLMNGVRNRIKATFVSLIPDEQWEKMIKKEADNFFASREKPTYYDRDKSGKSEFQLVCIDVMNEVAKIKIGEYLEQYKNEIWNGNELVANEKLKQLLIEYAPQILASMMANKCQQVINEMKNRGY